jgi:hypothetical protein
MQHSSINFFSALPFVLINVVLLLGAIKRNPCLFIPWLIVEIILFVLQVGVLFLVIFLVLVVAVEGVLIFGIILLLFLLLWLGLQGFFIYVVFKARTTINEDQAYTGGVDTNSR